MMTEARRILRLANLDLNELNRVMAQIAERLDQIEGYRGTPTFQAATDHGGNKVQNVGQGTGLTDALTVAQLYPVGSVHISYADTNPSSYLGGTWTQTGTDTLAGATVYLWNRTA